MGSQTTPNRRWHCHCRAGKCLSNTEMRWFLIARNRRSSSGERTGQRRDSRRSRVAHVTFPRSQNRAAFHTRLCQKVSIMWLCLRSLMRDEVGFIVSAELVLIATLLVVWTSPRFVGAGNGEYPIL